MTIAGPAPSCPASLCIVAGGGVLPAMLAEQAGARGISIFMVRLEGHADRDDGFPGITARPEQLGRIFGILRERGISDLVLIGRMRRPRLWALRPDWTTLRLLPRIVKALCFKGDDALLRAVRRMLEGEGFCLHGIQEFAGELLTPVGVFSAKAPDGEQLQSIRAGIAAARALGAADKGQAVVVCGHDVIGREGVAGTDALIAAHAVPGAILVKTAKPQQDRALDLPSIGPETVARCAQAGYAGIAVEAGATLLADRDAIEAMANKAGLFLIGVQG